MKLEDVFITYRNQSFDYVIKDCLDGIISKKENLFFKTIFENSLNEISDFIKNSKANKEISESDFNWTILLYFMISIKEFYDIIDRVKKTNDNLVKNSIDVPIESLVTHFKKVLDNKEVTELESIFEFIKSLDSESNTYEEFLLQKSYLMYKFFKENNTNMQEIPKNKLLEIAEKNYKNSIENFVKNCV